MYLIAIGRRYFSARRGYFGGLGQRSGATLFTLADATDRASRMVDAVVVAA
jgi:hypothetical protein